VGLGSWAGRQACFAARGVAALPVQTYWAGGQHLPTPAADERPNVGIRRTTHTYRRLPTHAHLPTIATPLPAACPHYLHRCLPHFLRHGW